MEDMMCQNDIVIRIYNAMVDGATEGLRDDELFDYVKHHVPATTSSRIVEASICALLDRHLTDVSILRVIYALAIKHRVDPVDGRHDSQVDRMSPRNMPAGRRSPHPSH